MLKRNSKRLASAYEKLFVELRRRSVFKVAIACVVVGWLLVQIAATLFPIFNALAQLPTLNVAARTSAFSFKGRNVNLNEVGTELGVRRVLEGSLRHSSNQLRVTAQLIITTEAMVAELPKEEAPMPGGDMGGMGGMM